MQLLLSSLLPASSDEVVSGGGTDTASNGILLIGVGLLWIPPIRSRGHECTVALLSGSHCILSIQLLHFPLVSRGVRHLFWRRLFAEGSSEISLLLISVSASIIAPEPILASIALREDLPVHRILLGTGKHVTLPVVFVSRGGSMVHLSIRVLGSRIIIAEDV